METLYDTVSMVKKSGKKKLVFTYTAKSKETGREIAAIFQRTFPDGYAGYGSVGGKSMYVKFLTEAARDEAKEVYDSELAASLNGTGPGDLQSYRGNKNSESGTSGTSSLLSGNTPYIVAAVVAVAIIGIVIWKRKS